MYSSGRICADSAVHVRQCRLNTSAAPEAFSWEFSTVKNFVFPKEGHQLQFVLRTYN